jgi:cytochrome P450
MLGQGSLILMEGDPHRRERRLLMPMFHGDRMKAYADIIAQVASDHLTRQPTDFLTLPMMTNISLDVIVRTIFGGETNELVTQLVAASQDIVRKSNPILFFSKRTHVSFLGMSPWDRYLQAKRVLYDRFDQIQNQRRQSQTVGDDILSMLMSAEYDDGTRLSDDHVREELMTFLFAGHETSALAMTWAIYHLHSNPKTLERLQSELRNAPIQSSADFASLPYLKAVVQETLRLNPIVTEVLRLLKKPLEFGDYVLPAGFGVAPAAVITHYNPEIYPEPDAFRPERFLERSFSPFEYFPFGGGARRCIGAAFASFEMAIVLGTMIRNYDFELLETKPVVAVRRNITLGPSSNVRMRKKTAR